jgi:CBS domain-containing protein
MDPAVRDRGAPALSSTMSCRRGRPRFAAARCLECAHRFGFRVDYDAGQLLVRCVFHGQDPVRDLMTLPAGFVSVDVHTPVVVAEDIARKNSVKHLLVTEGDTVVGTTCLCELIAGRGDGTVAGRMAVAPWVVPCEATLSDVARLMRTEETDLILVMDGRQLAGLVTDGDLCQVGVPEAVLERRACQACGTLANVCRHPRNAGMDFCLDCLERSVARDTETGLGD